MIRQQMSNAPLRAKKAWDNDIHVPDAPTTYKMQKQAENCTAVASKQQSINQQPRCTQNTSSSCSHSEGEIVTDEVKKVCKYK